MTSILQTWVQELGLRHQGCLISATRGCDNLPKDDPAKALVRCLRAEILVPFSAKPSSFIEKVTNDELVGRMNIVVGNFDHYPVHFIMHLMHAAHVIGVYHPVIVVSDPWRVFYHKMCNKMHVMPEPEAAMEKRMSADEETFRKANAEDIAEACKSDAYDMPDLFASDAYIGGGGLIARMVGGDGNGAGGSAGSYQPQTITRQVPMTELLPEAFCKGFSDYKCFNVTIASNEYSGGTKHQMWELGWHAARAAKHNQYADPRPRQEGYHAYYDNVHVLSNPYHAIKYGSQLWTDGWQRAKRNDELQKSKSAGHICDGNRGHCAQDCPDSEENKMAGLEATSAYVNQDRHGFDRSGFYTGHKPVKELDDEAARQYRGVRS